MADRRIVPTMCHGCSYGGYNCGMLAYVESGRFTRVEGNPHHPLNEGGLCAKGQAAAVQWVYNEKHLKTPLRRVRERGAGEFEEISWDEALKTVADRVMEIREKFGPETSSLQGGTNPNVLYDWEKQDSLSGDITKNTLLKIRRLSAEEG